MLIVDELYHEDIWRHWLESIEYSLLHSKDSDSHPAVRYRAQLFIHAKSPDKIRSEWVRSHTLQQVC